MDRKSYLGVGWHFPPLFVKHVGVVMALHDEDIKQSLRILFSTKPGERVFRPEFGCQVDKWVFGEMDLSTKTLIADAVHQAINHYEPRIEVERVEVNQPSAHEGSLLVNISYRIRQTNTRSNLVYPFYFKEGTIL